MAGRTSSASWSGSRERLDPMRMSLPDSWSSRQQRRGSPRRRIRGGTRAIQCYAPRLTDSQSRFTKSRPSATTASVPPSQPTVSNTPSSEVIESSPSPPPSWSFPPLPSITSLPDRQRPSPGHERVGVVARVTVQHLRGAGTRHPLVDDPVVSRTAEGLPAGGVEKLQQVLLTVNESLPASPYIAVYPNPTHRPHEQRPGRASLAEPPSTCRFSGVGPRLHVGALGRRQYDRTR